MIIWVKKIPSRGLRKCEGNECQGKSLACGKIKSVGCGRNEGKKMGDTSLGDLGRSRSCKALLVTGRSLDFILSMKERPWRVLFLFFLKIALTVV